VRARPGAFALGGSDSKSSAYKDKIRTLVFNLRNPDNGMLRNSIVYGAISAEKLVSMSAAVRAERPAQPRSLGSLPLTTRIVGAACYGRRYRRSWRRSTRSASLKNTKSRA